MLDLSEAPLHTPMPVWTALLNGARAAVAKRVSQQASSSQGSRRALLLGPKRASASSNSAGPNQLQIIMREHSAWAHGAMGLMCTHEAARDARDHFPALAEALRAVHMSNLSAQSAAAAAAAADAAAAAADAAAAAASGRSHSLQPIQPPIVISVDLTGVTVRRHTAARLPQLCAMQCLTGLTLFGKSAVAVPHGHRLAAQLAGLARLENVSLDDCPWVHCFMASC